MKVRRDVAASRCATWCDGATHATFRKFFDQIYYPVREATASRSCALYVHGNSDTTGSIRGVETITTGLKWKRLREPLSIIGEFNPAVRASCRELDQPDQC